MVRSFDSIVGGGIVMLPSGPARTDIGLRDGRIVALGELGWAPAAERVPARGLHVLPGVIDTHVHFREPGLTHKEDLATGSAAAIRGGVTSVCEMPNTQPPTTSAAALQGKLERARGRVYCDYAFYVGAAPDNLEALAGLETTPGCCGVKVFMGSSTGGLLLAEDRELAEVLRRTKRRVAVHAEDEQRLKERRFLAAAGRPETHPQWRDVETAVRAVRRLLSLAAPLRRSVHLLHVTSAEELELLAAHRQLASVEVTPQHLTLAAPGCYAQLGTRAQTNPPIREAVQRDALWAAVRRGAVDVVGSDHAPHSLEEKARVYPESPSGVPGVETLLPLLLDHVQAGRLELGRLVELTSAGPARVFGIAGKGRIAEGFDADLVLVDVARPTKLRNESQHSRCGWTPYDGRVVASSVVGTLLRGQLMAREGALLGRATGLPLRFL